MSDNCVNGGRVFFKSAFLYFFVSALVLGGIFVSYMTGSAVASAMDVQGWCFYVTATLSWAAVFALLPFGLSAFLYAVTRSVRASSVLHVVLTILLVSYFIVNGIVYAQYRFHINGFVLNMLFSEGAGDIFQFDVSIYVKLFAAFLFIVVAAVAVRRVCRIVVERWNYAAVLPASLLLVAALLFSNGFHAYAAVVKITSVIRSVPVVPYYFPLTANRFLHKIGVVSEETLTTAGLGSNGASGLNYPMKELDVQCDTATTPPQEYCYDCHRFVELSLVESRGFSQYLGFFFAMHILCRSSEQQQWYDGQYFRNVFRYSFLFSQRY